MPPTERDANQLLFSKFTDWKYEEEWRGWIGLDEPDASTQFYFYRFDGHIRLREIIAGPLCEVSEARIYEALKGRTKAIRVLKARLAFGSFRVVKNRKGFQS